MADSLRWGILGTGKIAEKFASELPRSRTGRLVAVGSRTTEAARAFAGRHPGTRPHGSCAELLADPEVDAVYIASPNPFHAAQAIAAARAGKQILCEKPFAMSAREAESVFAEAERAGVFAMEAFMYACHPQTERALDWIRSGAIGRVRLIEAAFCFAATYDPASRLFAPALGGGAILDVGCYTLSVARRVAGAASGARFENPSSLSGAIAPAPTGADAVAAATLAFPSGILAQLTCAVALAGGQGLVVHGETGRLRLPRFWNPPGPIELRDASGERVEPAEGSPFKYALEADAVADALPGRESPLLPWADTLGNMAALDAWRAAAASV